jgi:signal transduction histidine kinase
VNGPLEVHARGRWRPSARLRILGWSLLMIAAALTASTIATHVVSMRRVNAQIGNELSHEIQEFHALLRGNASAPPPTVLRAATAHAVPERSIALVGLVGRRVVSSTSTAAPLHLTSQSPLVARWAATVHRTSSDASSAAGPVRYIAEPFRARGRAQRGVFVAVVLTAGAHAAVWRATRLQIAVESIALVFAMLLAWLAAGRVLRPVRDTTELARRITDTDLTDRIPVHGHDEFSDLAVTINDMLDRLEASITTQRAFLADAGHELRTPITIVQGNLDTLRLCESDDIETIAIASDELQRMSRMVDDLMTLARSEQVDFLHLGPADVATLTAELSGKLTALHGHRWTVTGKAQGTCRMDRERITQAVLELGANAVTYTPIDTPLELSTAWVHTGSLAISVGDHGPGIPPDRRGRIFDRFARLDRRRTTGTGLGLSIVSAISHAHGGTVSVTDRADGPGAIFTIELPADPPCPES